MTTATATANRRRRGGHDAGGGILAALDAVPNVSAATAAKQTQAFLQPAKKQQNQIAVMTTPPRSVIVSTTRAAAPASESATTNGTTTTTTTTAGDSAANESVSLLSFVASPCSSSMASPMPLSIRRNLHSAIESDESSDDASRDNGEGSASESEDDNEDDDDDDDDDDDNDNTLQESSVDESSSDEEDLVLEAMSDDASNAFSEASHEDGLVEEEEEEVLDDEEYDPDMDEEATLTDDEDLSDAEIDPDDEVFKPRLNKAATVAAVTTKVKESGRKESMVATTTATTTTTTESSRKRPAKGKDPESPVSLAVTETSAPFGSPENTVLTKESAEMSHVSSSKQEILQQQQQQANDGSQEIVVQVLDDEDDNGNDYDEVEADDSDDDENSDNSDDDESNDDKSAGSRVSSEQEHEDIFSLVGDDNDNGVFSFDEDDDNNVDAQAPASPTASVESNSNNSNESRTSLLKTESIKIRPSSPVAIEVNSDKAEMTDTVEPKVADVPCSEKTKSRAKVGLQSIGESLNYTPTPRRPRGRQRQRRQQHRRQGNVKRGKWTLGSKIGSGAFGVVRIGMNTVTGTLMAVKSVQMERAVMKDVRREVDLLKSLEHRNIVRYHGAEMDKTHLHIFQEWVPGGSVTGMLSKFGPFTLDVLRSYLAQILEGLAYLHENDIMHRDIKGANVLVSDEGVVKLADFGASKRLEKTQRDMMQSLTIRGTPYFMAPEVFEEKYSVKADVWSVGCVAIQMATGTPPWKARGFSNPVSLFNHLKSHNDPPAIGIPSRDMNDLDFCLFKSFVAKCFKRDPQARPSAKSLQHDPFFSEVHNLSDDELSTSRGLFSPDSRCSWEGLQSPLASVSKLSPITWRMSRSSSLGPRRSPFLSPPLPKRAGPRMPHSPGPPALFSSPQPETNEWPTWARDKHHESNVGAAVGAASKVSKEEQRESLTGKVIDLMGSLAFSECSSMAGEFAGASLRSPLQGLQFMGGNNDTSLAGGGNDNK